MHNNNFGKFYSFDEINPNISKIQTNINFAGDKSFDVDILVNSDTTCPSTSSYIKEHMWLSLPFSRIVLNPGYEFDNGKITGVPQNLDLIFGVYYGKSGSANKTHINNIPIKESKSGFQTSSLNCLISIDNQNFDVNTITSSWYPHKLERSAKIKDITLSFTDFMIDENTICRIIDIDKLDFKTLNIKTSNSSTDINDFKNTNNLKCSYDSSNNMVIKTDELFTDENTNLFYSAMNVIVLNEDFSLNKNLTNEIIIKNTTDSFTYMLGNKSKKLAVIIGYANREEGVLKAIQRSKRNITNILSSYNKRKEFWNNILRKIPVPSKFGIDNIVYNSKLVSPQNHKLLYYSAFVFNIINIMMPTPETGYMFTQQALGKPSRQVAGAKTTPANNSWEGLLQIQNLMYINPSICWSALLGFISMISDTGYLDGEVLPVRLSQTIWMVHSISPNKDNLELLYPKLKKHLEYKIKYPMWIYENEKTENEFDSEFIISWLNDVIYIKKICLDTKSYKNDLEYWNKLYDEYLKKYTLWFFCNPLSHEAMYSYPANKADNRELKNLQNLPYNNHPRGIWTRIYQKDGDVNYFKDACTNAKRKFVHCEKHKITPHTPSRFAEESLQVLLSGLVLSDLPTEKNKQLEDLFFDIFDETLPLCGLENSKWAPMSFLIYGLIKRGYLKEAKLLVESCIVKSIEIWEFCENYFAYEKGPRGTSPTSFGASQIIECTFMLNGLINFGDGLKKY